MTVLTITLIMDFSMRSLTLISLGLGLISTGILSLAIATDYWLFSSEPVDFENMVMNGEQELDAEDLPDSLDMGGFEGYDYKDLLNGSDPKLILPMAIKLHSGLWRVCVYYEEGGGYMQGRVQKVPRLC